MLSVMNCGYDPFFVVAKRAQQPATRITMNKSKKTKYNKVDKTSK